MVLSGEGSDEILAGYPKYAFEHAFDRTLRWMPRGWLGGLASVLPFGMRRLQLALECVSRPDRFERYAGWFGAFADDERDGLLAGDLRDGPDVHGYSRGALRNHKAAGSVEEMLVLDLLHWLPANLLLRGDRMTMAHSLELRCPYLDYRLVDFAAHELPMDLKIRGMAGKWLLKQYAESLLPREIIHRPKWGFKVPIADWFRGALAGVLREVVLSPRALGRGYFREDALRNLVDLHVSGRRNLEKQLWILFQLELWHLMFVDRVVGPDDQLA